MRAVERRLGEIVVLLVAQLGPRAVRLRLGERGARRAVEQPGCRRRRDHAALAWLSCSLRARYAAVARACSSVPFAGRAGPVARRSSSARLGAEAMSERY